MTQLELLDELTHATLVTVVIADKDGETYRVELRGRGIERLRQMIEQCKCHDVTP